jgi:hypothetical protein
MEQLAFLKSMAINGNEDINEFEARKGLAASVNEQGYHAPDVIV